MTIKIIAGLGNPGSQYERTRHNIGFDVVEKIAALYRGSPWRTDGANKRCEIELEGSGSITLLKPQTYMNLSGSAVAPVLRFLKLKPEELLVIHDELDVEVGVVRIKLGGSSAGHRGVQNLIEALGSKEFFRLRIGIGRPERSTPGDEVVSYVLTRPSRSETTLIDGLVSAVVEGLPHLTRGDLTQAQKWCSAVSRRPSTTSQ